QQSILQERIELDWMILDALAPNDLAAMQKLSVLQIPMPSNSEDHFATINLRKKALFVGKKAVDRNAFVLVTPLDTIFEKLTQFEKAAYPFSLAFIDEQGNVLAGKQEPGSIFVKLPITGANFSLSLSAPEAAVKHYHQQWYIANFLSLLLVIAVVGGALVWVVTLRISKPLTQLSRVMERVGEGGVHVRYTPDRMGFEINELGKQFNHTLDQLQERTQEAEKERIARERLAEELKIGHDIQANLFPSHLPELKGLDVATGFLPAREVGGDFYDLFLLENGKLFIAIADAAGKGISACLYSLGLRSMLRTLASSGFSLSEIVLRANDLFFKDAHQIGMFITLWLAIYDPKTKTLEYVCQGHPPPFLLRKGELKDFSTPGIALGAQTFDAIQTKTDTLQPGDLLFLYTDGIIEAHDSDRQLYGTKRLQEFLLRFEKRSSNLLAERLLSEVELFCQGAIQHDDQTLLVIRVL
ncbi:MAG: HAMP domain-containing protein, partial [Chlamydiae bacterium]|nr:HAMP domain-containing protein [Chlamydiota bacterium]